MTCLLHQWFLQPCFLPSEHKPTKQSLCINYNVEKEKPKENQVTLNNPCISIALPTFVGDAYMYSSILTFT